LSGACKLKRRNNKYLPIVAVIDQSIITQFSHNILATYTKETEG
jgi:hypothetical protein